MSASVQKQGSDALAGGSVGWVLSRKPEGHGFNSQSGHVPRLQVRFPVGVHIGSSQSMFLSLFLLPFPLKKKKKKKKKKRKGVISQEQRRPLPGDRRDVVTILEQPALSCCVQVLGQLNSAAHLSFFPVRSKPLSFRVLLFFYFFKDFIYF